MVNSAEHQNDKRENGTHADESPQILSLGYTTISSQVGRIHRNIGQKY